MVSPQSAELALDCMQVVYRQWRATSQGSRPLPEKWRVAFAELTAALNLDVTSAGGNASGGPAADRSLSEQIDVATAAERLGITARAVRQRLASGALPGRKLGRQWLVEWQQKEDAA